MDSKRRIFVGLYALSGAAGLIYEVTWTRLLSLEMGHTVAAASTVLAAFMGGLAAGTWIAGQFPPSAARRLHSYAALEIVVALSAIVLPAILRAFVPALAWSYADGDTHARFAVVRLALSLALLGIPAVAMGATFPIATAWLTDVAVLLRPGLGFESAAETGALYAANTAGAAAGAIAAGFWLIPAVGLRRTTFVGVALNTIAALGALWIARAAIASPIAPARTAATERPTSKSKSPRTAPARRTLARAQPVLACGAAALCGFSALAYEVAWTRLLAMVIGPTTYAFATMAALFISGIAIGSAIGARLVRRVARPALWLALMLVVTGVSATFAAWFAASRLPLIVGSEVASPGALFDSVMLRETVYVTFLLLPMASALGAAFPFALAAASSDATSMMHDAARVYAANTTGAIAGALAAGFVLVPRLGLEGTIVAVSRATLVGALLIAATVLMRHAERTSRARGAIAGLAIAVAGLVALVQPPRWDRELLASGAYKHSRYIGDELDASLRAGTIVYYKEGAAATVAVRRLAGSQALTIDGKVDASNAGDMLTQRLLGLLPVLLHRDPRTICIIGLGSGVTLGSALASPHVRQADVVEISPEVVDASALFSRENGGALRDPRVRLVVGDGRAHLMLTTRTYDVIVSEPSNPWMAGVAALFTREFFAAARARLNPDGLLCQWAHIYEISANDLRSIVNTFASVFPRGTMWLVGDGDLLLIGSAGGDVEAGLQRIAERSRDASIAAALADVAVTPGAAAFDLLSLFAGGPAELARYGAGAVTQSDDRMALEFTAPRAVYIRTTNDNSAAIRGLTAEGLFPPAVAAARRSADAHSWRARGMMAAKADAYDMAYESFRHAVALDSHDVEALRGASEAAAELHAEAAERKWLETLASSEPANADVRVELSHVMAAAGDFDGAVAMASAAQRLDPASPRPAEQLASIFADLADAKRLEPLAAALIARFPDRDDSRYYHAASLFISGRPAAAADEARQLLTANPGYAKAENLLGAACATMGQRDCAQAAFERSIRLNPRDASAYVNLGLFYLEIDRPDAATDRFAEAIALDPRSSRAKDGLVQARAALTR